MDLTQKIEFAQCSWCRHVFTMVSGERGIAFCSGECRVMMSIEFEKRRAVRRQRRRRYEEAMRSIQEEDEKQSETDPDESDESDEGFMKVDEKHLSPTSDCQEESKQCTPLSFEPVLVCSKTLRSNLKMKLS